MRYPISMRLRTQLRSHLFRPDVSVWLPKINRSVLSLVAVLITAYFSHGQQTQQQTQQNFDQSIYSILGFEIQERAQLYPAINGKVSGYEKEAIRFSNIWGPRLYPHGDVRKIYAAQKQYIDDFNAGNRGFCGKYDNVDWEAIGPNEVPDGTSPVKGSGQINRLTFSPSYDGTTNKTIYGCSHYGGVFKTTDGGNSWNILGTDLQLPFTGVADLAVNYANENILFIAVSNGDGGKGFVSAATWAQMSNPIPTSGVYRSTDGGGNWEPISGSLLSDLPDGVLIRRIVTVPNNSNILIIATTEGIYRCSNALAVSPTWTQVGTGTIIGDPDIRGLEFKPGAPSKIYASGRHVYYSSNYGVTWSILTSATSTLNLEHFQPFLGTSDRKFEVLNINIAVTPANASRVYAYIVAKDVEGENRNWAFIYYKQGTTWTQIDAYEGIGAFKVVSPGWIGIAVSPINAEMVFYGHTYLRGTTNFTTTTFSYKSPYSGNGYHADVHDLSFEPITTSPQLFAGHHGGVSRRDPTAPGETGWTYLNTGLHCGLIWGHDNSDIKENQFVIASQDAGTSVHGADATNWKTIYGGDGYGAQIYNEEGFYVMAKGTQDFDIKSFSIAGDNSTLYESGPTLYESEHHLRPPGHVHNSDYDEAYPPAFQVRYHPETNAPIFGLNDLHERLILEAPGGASYFWEAQSNLGYVEDFHWIYSRRINDFEIANSNPNYVYISTHADYAFTDGVYHEARNLKSGLFRSIDGLSGGDDSKDDFVNIGLNLPPSMYPNPAGGYLPLAISAIEVDPSNENRIWVSFSGYEGDKKVWYSSNAGDTWTNYDLTGSLANLPVNDLLYQPGSTDRIFAATDAGVYVKEPGTEWCRYGNIPNVRVMGLRINPCNQKLSAATQGRGLWECGTPTAKSVSVYRTYTSPETIDGVVYSTGNIVIKPGVTLTITGTLYMPKSGVIQVEQGAKLKVKGGTITNRCGSLWGGIEVWGTSDESQFGSGNQGEVVLSQNALLEHAQEAIQAWRPGHWDKTGGIVKVYDSQILNCKRAASFMNYTNYYLGNRYNNKGTFQNVSFYWTDDFRVDEALEMVSLYKVDGITFNACRFEDQRSILPASKRSHGIHSLNSSFQVSSSCASLSGCPDDITDPSWNISTFRNLDVGILFGNSSSAGTTVINRCEFSNNLTGVDLSYAWGIELTRNRFLCTPETEADVYNWKGAILNYCSDYRVEENKFLNTNPTFGFSTVGVIVENSGPMDNELYKNQFDNQSVGVFALGLNRYLGSLAQNGRSGLEFYCNDHTNNRYDFYVTGSESYHGVKRSNGIYDGSGNTFSHLGPFSMDYSNTTGNLINYYSDHVITSRTPLDNVGLELGNTNPTSNTCPTRFNDYPGGFGVLLSPFTKSALQNSFSQTSQSLPQKIAQLDNLMDGGNTQALLNQIANAGQNTSTQVKNQLLSTSPFLSDLVINAVLNASSQVFANQWKRDLILANIEVAYLPGFISNLNLPTQMVASIQSAVDAGQTTSQTTLRNEIDNLHREEAFAVKMLLGDLQKDTLTEDTNAIRSLMSARMDPLKQLHLIDDYQHTGNYSTASTLTNALAATVSSYPAYLQASVSDFVTLNQSLNGVLTTKGAIANLDAQTLDQYRLIANSGEGIAKAQAQSILCFFYGECATTTYQIPSLTSNRLAQDQTVEEEDLLAFSLFPNPANKTVQLEWSGAEKVLVQVVDLAGKSVHLSEHVGNRWIWDTTTLPGGVYFVTVYEGAQFLGTRKLVIGH